MSELLHYSLGDLLLFSEATYFELLSFYHHAIWPLQIFAIMLSGCCCWLLYKPRLLRERIVLIIFAISWLWLGLVFQGTYYSSINWLVKGFVVLFCLQASLLLWLAVWQPRLWKAHSEVTPASDADPEKQGKSGSLQAPKASLAVIISVTLLLPLFLLLRGRHWDQLEIIFITPDATALATLGLLWSIKSNVSLPVRSLFALVPLFWCLFSLLTWLAMASVSGG